MMDELEQDELTALLDSYRGYLMNLNAWIYQYMPWGVGRAIHRKDKAYFQAGLALARGL